MIEGRRGRSASGAENDECDAPPSIYDAPDADADDDLAEALDPTDEDAVGRWPPAWDDGSPGNAAWRSAAGACAVELAEAAAAFARIDERLRVMPPPERDAARARLATLQATRLLWASGGFVAPEAVALDALDRRSRADDDAPAVTLARRLARLLAREALDMRDAACPDVPPLVAAALVAPPRDAGDAGLLDAEAERLRLAARVGRGGAPFAPVPARRRVARADPASRLAAFLADVADGARDALALLDDLAAWRARADHAAAAMKGGTPARMVGLLAQRPAVSAPAAASVLRISDDAALRVLMRLEHGGIARELTGQGRFRVWAARL